MNSKQPNANLPSGAKAAAPRPWQRPAIEWEEAYEPVVFAASCTVQPLQCGAGARD